MSNRTYHAGQTQGVRYVQYDFAAAGASVTTNPATFVGGDTSGASAGSYVTSTKVATGKYAFTTTDPFLAVVCWTGGICMANPDNNTYAQFKIPTQNANGTWHCEVWVLKNSAGTFTLTDLTAGDQLHCNLTLRNSTSLP